MASYPSSGVAPYMGDMISEKMISHITRHAVLDFAKLVAKKGSAFSAADVIQALPVYQGEIVKNVFLKVHTPSTNAAVVGVGDGASTQGYLANTTAIGTGSSAGALAGVTAGALLFTSTNVTSLGKLYGADDTIDVLIGATVPADGVIELIAEIVRVAAY